MKKICMLIFCGIIIVIIIYLVIINCGNNHVEYVPEEEILESDLRNTIITLYFGNNENSELRN